MLTPKLRVLVVGQTPPPYHGQAIMIEKLVNAGFDQIAITHLRMSFSANLEEVGRFRLKKIFHLFRLLFQGIHSIFARKIDLLYYPPAGPNWIPILRDMILLTCWRVLVPNVIYHFRAGGISEFLESRSRIAKLAARASYGRPAAAILLSRFNPNDAEFFGARKIFTIPNGLEDTFSPQVVERNHSDVRLFYIGLLNEEKGINVLLDAFRLISAEDSHVSLHLAGEFASMEFRTDFLHRVEKYGLRNKIILYGNVTSQAKWELFGKMDILCFLTHYPSETFGNSVLEGMIWQLPVVATRWRGVQDLVLDQETGFLIPIRDHEAAAEKLRLLVKDPEMRARFGKNGRERFIQEFTLEKHLGQMEAAMLSAVGRGSARIYNKLQ